jgi:hypothetical protein
MSLVFAVIIFRRRRSTAEAISLDDRRKVSVRTTGCSNSLGRKQKTVPRAHWASDRFVSPDCPGFTPYPSHFKQLRLVKPVCPSCQDVAWRDDPLFISWRDRCHLVIIGKLVWALASRYQVGGRPSSWPRQFVYKLVEPGFTKSN